MRVRLRSRRGQALVEFALVLPILMLILLGILEMGRAWNAKEVLTDAAREGVRLAVVGNPAITDTSQVNPVIRLKIAAAGLDSTQLTITWTNFKAGTGTIAAAALSYPFAFVALHHLVRLAGVVGDTLTLQTTARMRNE